MSSTATRTHRTQSEQRNEARVVRDFKRFAGMTSFDGRYFYNLQAEQGRLINPIHNTTTANVVSKVKSAIASAFRVSTPAMALA